MATKFHAADHRHGESRTKSDRRALASFNRAICSAFSAMSVAAILLSSCATLRAPTSVDVVPGPSYYPGKCDLRNRTEQFLWDAPTAGDAERSLLITSAELFTGENTPGCLLASATASGSKESADVRAAVTEVRRRIMDRLFARIEHMMSRSAFCHTVRRLLRWPSSLSP